VIAVAVGNKDEISILPVFIQQVWVKVDRPAFLNADPAFL
jgi:hypothetical protein